MGRNANGRSTVYLGADGLWHGRVTVGVKADGTPDRRHRKSKSRAVVTQKVRDLERLRDAGTVANVGAERWTLAAWLEHWLENIAKPSLKESSYDAYRNAVRTHLIPGVGKHKLDKLEPEHLETLYRRMIDAGARPGNAHQVHRTVKTALAQAEARGVVTRNVARLAKAPKVEEHEVDPYTLAEVQAIIVAAKERRNSARWVVALALGMRQGEVLGLRWQDVDLDTNTLRARKNRPRPKYAHGCTETCGKTSGYCPKRVQTNKDDASTKSRAGRRVIGLPDELVALLKLHREEQDVERARAGQLWNESGRVFTKPTGETLNPNSDYHEWKALLRRAGVRDARLHDARHTAATILLVLGVPERTVMSLMGWSSTAMAARYQHVTDPIRRDVAERVGGLLWASKDQEGKVK
jgi:integrase